MWGTNYWKIDGEGDIRAAIQTDLSKLTSGKYDYTLNNGFNILQDNEFLGASTDSEGQLLHVNSIESAFGSGWGISGGQVGATGGTAIGAFIGSLIEDTVNDINDYLNPFNQFDDSINSPITQTPQNDIPTSRRIIHQHQFDQDQHQH